DLLGAQARDKGVEIAKELREVVRERRGEPAAVAAACDVRADDARVRAQRARELVEVAPVAAVAVSADRHARRVGRAPRGVVQLVEAAPPRGGEAVVGRLGGWSGALRFELTAEVRSDLELAAPGSAHGLGALRAGEAGQRIEQPLAAVPRVVHEV